MLNSRRLRFVEVFEFVFFTAMHIFYSTFIKDMYVTELVVLFSIGLDLLVIACLIFIKNEFWNQIGFSLCVVVTVHLIGTAMGSLAYGIVFYMMAGTIISINGNRYLNRVYFFIVNVAMILELIFEYDVIVSVIPIHFYVMIIFTCEMYMLVESYLVVLYQQNLEEIQIQNEILNLAQQSKDQFLANMSHEIRTPMNAIVGMSELIMREDINPKVEQYCHNIETSGQNLLAIINDILDFSKIESGQMRLVNEPYSISSIVNEVVNMAVFRRSYKDISIIVDMRPDIPNRLEGDEVRIKQVLTNIVTNAVKFTKQGYVFISVSCYKREGINILKLEVKDTGVGIKKEDLSHLFESFTRLDTKKNRSIEGTGLGLAICKRLVELMHGTIKVSSTYRKGTTVTIEVPQAIVDGSPSLVIDNKNMKVISYMDLGARQIGERKNYYKMAYDHLWAPFDIDNLVVTEYGKMYDAVESGQYTHLIIGTEEYRTHRPYFDEISEKIRLFVMYDPRYDLHLKEGIFGITLPFCAVSIIFALNGETTYTEINDERQQSRFITPDAKILVVDDNEINLKVTEGILGIYKAGSILVKSGHEAISVLASTPVDLVLMDHMMPELDGVETTRIIRQTGAESFRNVPIIAMTANVVNDVQQMFLENGFQDFLPKPVTVSTLGEVLVHWLPKEYIKYVEAGAEEDNTSSQKTDVKNDQPANPSTSGAQRPDVAIDAATAIENMGGQRDLFKELLEYCLELEEKRWNDLDEQFVKEDWKEYTIQVHALKGGMRSLGIEELALAAQGLEHACKEGRIDDVKEGHPKLKELYDFTHRCIERFLVDFEV
ncbi:MAG: response regulator [Lachnospiraceae bacterium]|jgi:signal transduction histidine kinase/DNA-binding NarL/FixJ family response regulator/HPt (histidine-containing phosphotransfer) domain-containing protein|nr:response regulator [Lachnospiraceae bacterium]